MIGFHMKDVLANSDGASAIRGDASHWQPKTCSRQTTAYGVQASRNAATMTSVWIVTAFSAFTHCELMPRLAI